MTKADASQAVLVTFRRRISGRTFQVGFDCGSLNNELILREAWNTNSSIENTEPLR
jgi:hypothetical protein